MTRPEAARLELEFAEKDLDACEKLFIELNDRIAGAAADLHRARLRLSNAQEALRHE
jgi:hypothetical protein